MKPRFEPDLPANPDLAASEDRHFSARLIDHNLIDPDLIDPEAYDASEQQFAASLEQTAACAKPIFIVEDELPQPTAVADFEKRWSAGPSSAGQDSKESGTAKSFPANVDSTPT